MCKFSSKFGGVPFQPLGDLTWNDPSIGLSESIREQSMDFNDTQRLGQSDLLKSNFSTTVQSVLLRSNFTF